MSTSYEIERISDVHDKDIMNRKKKATLNSLTKRLMASILCIAVLLTTFFPDGGTAFAASFNQEILAAVREDGTSDPASEDGAGTTASQSIKTDVGSDTTNEQLESPLAPAIGGGPLSAEEMAREEELFEKRAKAAGAEQGHRLFRLCPDGEVRLRGALQPCRER